MGKNMKDKWIVCAACRRKHDGLIVAGARHMDSIMAPVICLERELWLGCEQGFIDNFGEFHTRKEAWVIAEENEQITHRCGGDGLDRNGLFSENLY